MRRVINALSRERILAKTGADSVDDSAPPTVTEAVVVGGVSCASAIVCAPRTPDMRCASKGKDAMNHDG